MVATPIADAPRGGNESATQLKELLFRGPLGTFIDPEQIANAVVAGIEARPPRITEPKPWAPASSKRGPINMLADRLLAKDPEVQRRLIRRIDAEERQRQAGQRGHEGMRRKSAARAQRPPIRARTVAEPAAAGPRERTQPL